MSFDFTKNDLPSDYSSGMFTLGSPYANIERQLERIANALEKLADDGSRECTLCHRMAHCYTDMPYGTDIDGEIVCADCLQRALDALRGIN